MSGCTEYNVYRSVNCYADLTCNHSIPRLKPKVKIDYQLLSEPSINFSGLTGISADTSDYKIYNLNNDLYLSEGFTITGDTSDMDCDFSFLKFDIYPYDIAAGRFIPDSQVTRIFDKIYDYTDLLSINFDDIDTLSYYAWIIKPSFITKDKLKDNTWIDTKNIENNNLGIIDINKDLYFVTTRQPEDPILLNSGVIFTGTTQNLYSQDQIAINVLSGITSYALNFTTNGHVMAIVNGVTLIKATSISFADGDYFIQGNVVLFAPSTINNGDLISLVYVIKGNLQSFYSETIVTPSVVSTGTTESIYQNGYYYFLNQSYEPKGNVLLYFNGQKLTENSDYQRISTKTVKLLNVTYSGLSSGDTFNIVYLTTFNVINNVINKTPIISFNIQDRLLNSKEEVEYNLIQTGVSGTTLIERSSVFFYPSDQNANGSFIMNIPAIGGYEYYLIHKRYYKLINGKTIKIEKKMQNVQFTMSSAIFFS